MVCILGMGDCGSETTVENVFKMKSLTQKIFKQWWKTDKDYQDTM